MLMIAWFVLIAACPAPRACTCVSGPTPSSPAAMAAYLEHEAAVFEGEVLRIEFAADSGPPLDGTRPPRRLRWTSRVATFRVAGAWKGDLPDTVVVRTAAQATMCGADFAEGRRYLVFAYPRDHSGLGAVPPADASTVLFASKCGLTRPLDARARELERLLPAAPARAAPRPD